MRNADAEWLPILIPGRPVRELAIPIHHPISSTYITPRTVSVLPSLDLDSLNYYYDESVRIPSFFFFLNIEQVYHRSGWGTCSLTADILMRVIL
jgi:hypothetical protein